MKLTDLKIIKILNGLRPDKRKEAQFRLDQGERITNKGKSRNDGTLFRTGCGVFLRKK